jgi:uncharacterized spore protein YtfJ
MEQVRDIIGQVINTLSDISQSDVVVGAPIVVGKVTLVPLSRVAAGFGGGGGEGDGDMPKGKNQPEGSGTGKGGGSGGGAIVRPVAMVVFGEEGVEILPIAEKQGKLEKLLDQIPDLIERFKDKMETKSE